MASVRKRRESAFWYACITLEDGRQRQFSTGLTERDEALAVAVAAERAARRNVDRPHQLRKALDRLAEDFVPATDRDPAEWLESWVTSRKAEVAENTFATYENTVTEVADWLRGARVGSFSALTPARVMEMRVEWSKKNSPRTVNTKMKHLRMALKVAVREKMLEVNPAEDFSQVREQATPRREFRGPELELLVPTLAGEWRGIFFLGLYTGQRLNDLAVLKWHQVDLEKGSVKLVASKTGMVVDLPLMKEVLAALKLLPRNIDPAAPVFPEISKMAKQTRSNTFRMKLAAVGLSRKLKVKRETVGARTVSELSFHSLRHTATTMLKAAGVSDAIARAIVGHSSAAVSRSYTHLDVETMRAALEKMPAVG